MQSKKTNQLTIPPFKTTHKTNNKQTNQPKHQQKFKQNTKLVSIKQLTQIQQNINHNKVQHH